MNKEVSWKISFLGFISTIIIFLHHANLMSYENKIFTVKYVVMNFFTWLVIFAMSWFVFISAYLFFRSFKLSDLSHKLRSRVYSLVVPYLIWNTITVILKVFNHKQIFGNGIWNFIQSNYLFLNQGDVADGPLWFVFRLLTYIVCAPFIYFICTGRESQIKFSIIFFALVLYNNAVKTGYYSFLFFLPHYLVGAYLALNYSSKFEKLLGGGYRQHRYAIYFLIYFMIFCCCIGGAFNENGSTNTVCYIVQYFARLVVIPVTICLASAISFSSQPHPFVRESGMYILGFHELGYRFLRMIIMPTKMDILLKWILIIVANAVMIVLSWAILKKWFPLVLSLLSGGRNQKVFVEK